MATNAVALRGRRALRFAVDRLSFAITQGDTEEFVRLLKKEAADLHEAFDRVNNLLVLNSRLACTCIVAHVWSFYQYTGTVRN